MNRDESSRKDRGRRYGGQRVRHGIQLIWPGNPCWRRASVRYRLGKLAHYAALATAAAILLTLVAGVAVSTWQAVAALRAEREAAEQREAAATAERVAVNAQKQTAESRQALRRSLYAADLELAQNAWNSKDVPGVLELLERQRPAQGDPDLRGLEWHFWQRMCHADLRAVLLAGAHPTNALLSSDSRQCVGVIAAPGQEGLREGEIRIWDTTSGARRLTIVPFPGNPLNGFSAPVLGQDGRSLAMSTDSVRVWDTATGKVRFSRHTGPVTLALDRNGKRIAVAPWSDGKSTGKVWAIDGAKELFNLPNINGHVLAMSFSPDDMRLGVLSLLHNGREAATTCEVVVWETKNGKEIFRIKEAVATAWKGALA